ncbi:CbtA family protein [Aureimonas fodinaquatilis]|uniref:CbtA family protein n=1 Tax=Aureimonas fodinaquatilis TaxID=2565783 RepID=A0A5B0DWX3_9HYPH|nr:CbtA family protein [Aureimonas fodinaquatilis]KAA0970355.1 CbtA family protein [Aureimonas fodinaquatilis]
MTVNLLVRGMLAGLFAGLIAFGFAHTFGEPQIERAIAFEELMAAEQPMGDEAGVVEAEEPAPVSRETQAGIGLFTAIALYAVAMGGIFSIVFTGLYGRVGNISPRALSLMLGLAAFIALVLVPDLKYPPNPPAVGDPETIGPRTGLFFITMIVSIIAMYLAVVLWQRLLPALGRWNAAIAALVAYILVLAVVLGLLPTINEVPENFPALSLYQFRLATVGMQLTIWTTIALAFGYLAEKTLVSSGHYRGGARVPA